MFDLTDPLRGSTIKEDVMKLIRKRTTLAAVGAALATAGIGGGISLAGAAVSSAPARTGTAKVTVTLPSGVVKQRAAHNVTCTVAGATYTVATTKAGARGRATKLTVTGYHGAGDYTGSFVMTGHSALGSFTRNVKLPVTLTADGGTVTRTRTLKGRVDPANAGKTITRSLSWTCA
ncbi:MAG TPA: hypothetical protein VG165_03865 [Solirubrobacteraceae bacterium]|nr:hypothetical protein [Solirubrobacteraceae bacterium]